LLQLMQIEIQLTVLLEPKYHSLKICHNIP
jgi:hypothetical protein